MKMIIGVTGATGFIGRTLCRALEMDGHTVIRLVRQPKGYPREVVWSVEAGLRDAATLEGCDAVVHLAGENIAGGLWTEARKKRIQKSRVDGTKRLVQALSSLSQPPRTFLCASAIGIYGDRGNTVLTEDSEPGQSGFLVQVAKEWEQAAQTAQQFGARIVALRFGIVLGKEGGALPRMLLPFRWGMGGRLGSGQQWWSWVSLVDAVRAIEFVLSHETLSGAVNITAPEPVTNGEFTRVLGHVLHRPTLFQVPTFVLKLVGGQMAQELFLASTRVVPQKLSAAGFSFQHPTLKIALHALVT